MKNLFKKSPSVIFFWTSLLLVVIAVIGMVVFLFFYDENLYATVAGKKISKQDINTAMYGVNFAGTKENPIMDDQELAQKIKDRIIEREIAKQKANEIGITVTDVEIEEEMKKRLGDEINTYTEEQKSLTREAIKGDLYILKVKESVVKRVEGDFVVFRFDRGIQEGLSNYKEIMASDKDYALKLSNDLYQKIKNGTITAKQAMDVVDNDSKIGKPAWYVSKNYNYSQSFLKETAVTYETEYFMSPDFLETVFAMKKGLNAPKIINVTNDEENLTLPSIYIMPYITNVSGEYNTYQDWLNEQISLKVKYAK